MRTKLLACTILLLAHTAARARVTTAEGVQAARQLLELEPMTPRFCGTALAIAAAEARQGADPLVSGLRAAGEPTRLRLLALTAQAELSVTELTNILGQSQPRVSRHLKLLCDAGLLERMREGTSAFYRIAQGGASAGLASTPLAAGCGRESVGERRLKALLSCGS